MMPDMRSLMSLVSEDVAVASAPSQQPPPQQPPAPVSTSRVSNEFREKLSEILNEYSARTAAPKPVRIDPPASPPKPAALAEAAPQAARSAPRVEPYWPQAASMTRSDATAPVSKPVSRVESVAPITKPVSRVGSAAPFNRPSAQVEPAAPITKPASRVESVAPISKAVARVEVAPRKPVLPLLFAEPAAAVVPEFSPEMAVQLAGINVKPVDDDGRPVAQPVEVAEPVVATRATDREGSFFHDAVPTLDLNAYQEWPVESGVMIAELLASLDKPAAAETAPEDVSSE